MPFLRSNVVTGSLPVTCGLFREMSPVSQVAPLSKVVYHWSQHEP